MTLSPIFVMQTNTNYIRAAMPYLKQKKCYIPKTSPSQSDLFSKNFETVENGITFHTFTLLLKKSLIALL